MTNTNTPKGAEGDVRPRGRNAKAPATGIAKASRGTGTGTQGHSTPPPAKAPRGGRALDLVNLYPVVMGDDAKGGAA